jgi:hypothetical protein
MISTLLGLQPHALAAEITAAWIDACVRKNTAVSAASIAEFYGQIRGVLINAEGIPVHQRPGYRQVQAVAARVTIAYIKTGIIASDEISQVFYAVYRTFVREGS